MKSIKDKIFAIKNWGNHTINMDNEMKAFIKSSKLYYVKSWLEEFTETGFDVYTKEEIKTQLEGLLAEINQTIKENE